MRRTYPWSSGKESCWTTWTVLRQPGWPSLMSIAIRPTLSLVCLTSEILSILRAYSLLKSILRQSAKDIGSERMKSSAIVPGIICGCVDSYSPIHLNTYCPIMAARNHQLSSGFEWYTRKLMKNIELSLDAAGIFLHISAMLSYNEIFASSFLLLKSALGIHYNADMNAYFPRAPLAMTGF